MKVNLLTSRAQAQSDTCVGSPILYPASAIGPRARLRPADRLRSVVLFLLNSFSYLLSINSKQCLFSFYSNDIKLSFILGLFKLIRIVDLKKSIK